MTLDSYAPGSSTVEQHYTHAGRMPSKQHIAATRLTYMRHCGMAETSALPAISCRVLFLAHPIRILLSSAGSGHVCISAAWRPLQQ